MHCWPCSINLDHSLAWLPQVPADTMPPAVDKWGEHPPRWESSRSKMGPVLSSAPLACEPRTSTSREREILLSAARCVLERFGLFIGMFPCSIDQLFASGQRDQYVCSLIRTGSFCFCHAGSYITTSWGNLEGGNYAGRESVAELASNLRYHSVLKAISRQVDSI